MFNKEKATKKFDISKVVLLLIEDDAIVDFVEETVIVCEKEERMWSHMWSIEWRGVDCSNELSKGFLLFAAQQRHFCHLIKSEKKFKLIVDTSSVEWLVDWEMSIVCHQVGCLSRSNVPARELQRSHLLNVCMIRSTMLLWFRTFHTTRLYHFHQWIWCGRIFIVNNCQVHDTIDLKKGCCLCFAKRKWKMFVISPSRCSHDVHLRFCLHLNLNWFH